MIDGSEQTTMSQQYHPIPDLCTFLSLSLDRTSGTFNEPDGPTKIPHLMLGLLLLVYRWLVCTSYQRLTTLTLERSTNILYYLKIKILCHRCALPCLALPCLLSFPFLSSCTIHPLSINSPICDRLIAISSYSHFCRNRAIARVCL